MRRDEVARAADLRDVGDRLRAATEHAGGQDDGGHGHALATVREATHQGHRIVIRTTYEVEVDDRPVEGHLLVSDDGRVHYHPVPNLSWASAVDLVKQLIEVFPDDFPPSDGDGDEGQAHHGPGHDHRSEADVVDLTDGHDHGGGR